MNNYTQSAKAMAAAIGQTVEVSFDNLLIHCIVIDVKAAWGRNRLLVKPVAGQGEQWVETGRICAAVPAARVNGLEVRA